MFLSNLSIRRPVFASVMMLTLVTLGLFSYKRLAIELMPNVEFPVVAVITAYEGASPETVEREVTKRMEEALNPLAGVKHIISYSREGVSTVIAIFELNIVINDASQEARARINAIRGELPLDIEDPIIQKMDINSSPIIALAVKSDSLTPQELAKLVDKKIKRRIENIQGVGKIDLVGDRAREVRVNLDPARLEAIGMGVDEVIVGLRSENVNQPLGRLNHGDSEITIRIAGKPKQVEDFRQMVIAQRDGHPVMLADVAQIEDGIEEQRSMALVNGVPAVAVNIMKQSGANTVDVITKINREITALQSELPEGVTIEIVQDTSKWILDSVKDVIETIIIGGFLTITIVFLFLNSWRSTVITGLTLPISVISAFIIMNFMGMTLNVLTLMALSLAIGLLIDDAIVVRENIVRHLEHGEDHFTAARNGTSEIGLAVLATSMSIIAVFIPVAFMKGIVGKFFYHFGITVAFAVLVSLFVSFTLDPMLSSRWVDPDIERAGKRNRLSRALDRFNAWFDRTADRYKILIAWALDHRKTTMLAALGAFVLGLMVFSVLPSSFMTEFDQEEFIVRFRTAPGASLDETHGRMAEVDRILKDFPEVHHTYATLGAGDSGTVRDGWIYVKLTGKDERDRDQWQVMHDLRQKLAGIPGIISSVELPSEAGSAKPVQINIRGEDIELLKQYAQEFRNELWKHPGIVDIDVTMLEDMPEYRLRVDRERAVSSGVMTSNITTTLGALVGGQAVTTFEDEEGDAVDVRVRLPEALRRDIAQVQSLRLSVPSEDGPVLVPLGDIVSYERGVTPSEINRQAMTRQITISANLEGVALGDAMKIADEVQKTVKMAPGYRVVYSGESEDMVESFGYMAESLLLAIIFVYLILAAQFESFVDPFAIMLSLPLSIVGMAGMLFLTGDTVNIMSLIGLIMLMGLVTKNAILLIDYAKVLRERGYERRQAMIEAGRTRLRPIIMTTLAMIFGMLPVALALGSGAEMRAPMGRAVIGGLITSTILTLIVVPVVYVILDDFTLWLKRKWSGPSSAVRGV